MLKHSFQKTLFLCTFQRWWGELIFSAFTFAFCVVLHLFLCFQHVACEEHHPLCPLSCTPWSSNHRPRHISFGSLFSSTQWHLATSRLGITCCWNTRIFLPILRPWCPVGQGGDSHSGCYLRTDTTGAVIGILTPSWGSSPIWVSAVSGLQCTFLIKIGDRADVFLIWTPDLLKTSFQWPFNKWEVLQNVYQIDKCTSGPSPADLSDAWPINKRNVS